MTASKGLFNVRGPAQILVKNNAEVLVLFQNRKDENVDGIVWESSTELTNGPLRSEWFSKMVLCFFSVKADYTRLPRD